jgi:hypothetical protein
VPESAPVPETPAATVDDPAPDVLPDAISDTASFADAPPARRKPGRPKRGER